MSSQPSEKGLVSLTSHLQALAPSDGSRKELFTSVIPAVIDAVGDIAKALQKAHHVALAGTANTFGDDQLNVDVAAENILRGTFAAKCPSVVTASSEEDPIEKPVHSSSSSSSSSSSTQKHRDQGPEAYTIAFDPLDGSSIIAPNWTVGTILGVWDGATAVGQHAETRQVVSVLGVYGPRTTAVVAVRVPGSAAGPVCFEVGLRGRGGADDAEVLRPEVRLAAAPFKTRYFAPANLRAAGQDERYMALVGRYIREGYTLRYSGGLVPDVVHALVKGHGVYVSPVTGTSKAKLRRLFELFPVALILECAGGKAVDPTDGRRILDVVLESTDERAGLVCGTAEEVDAVVKALVG
ncbi:Sedoheptulose-1,7-bisphosphatase, chloroplastic [Cytospora mali]|uniref:Sedoheptulose-1,7-bisphosphatase, chloroplastic n=1 Tax=Cytospora mali TaxID=578113 RepID=A0A194VRQ1_CYTMA|nr:Sedoheptulose-1,7-bisphosphatase, chloroplastic [Valsa mali]